MGMYVPRFTAKSRHSVSLLNLAFSNVASFPPLTASQGFISADLTAASEQSVFCCWMTCLNMGCDFTTLFVHYQNWFLKPLVVSIYVQARYHRYHQKSDNLNPFSPWKTQYVSVSTQHLLKCPWVKSSILTWTLIEGFLVEYQMPICTKYPIIICNLFGGVWLLSMPQTASLLTFITQCLTIWRLLQ